MFVIAKYNYSLNTFTASTETKVYPTGDTIPDGYTPVAISRIATGNVVCTLIAANENTGELMIYNNTSSQRT